MWFKERDVYKIMSDFKTIKTKYTPAECRVVFPLFEMYGYAALIGMRMKMEASIPDDHDIVLRKMAEICGDEWPIDLLRWMYLVNDTRYECIKAYRKIIEDAATGEIEVGTKEEAFDA